ncbi:MAG TPA: SDR family oxidoreductase [Pseudonocardiaceae bacterium]|nr:SDR family oxidoreductase [Pseudonocardiaceae bacterium]
MGVLEGKAALVTGGSRGIGRAIVTRLVADGATVVFSYGENKDAAAEVVAAGDGKAFAVQADQGDLADQEALFEEAMRLLGGLDILVNNAAIGQTGAIADVTPEMYDRAMDVNAKGPYFAMQFAGKHMRDNGRIINISTVNTRIVPAMASLYAGSKGALELFSRVAAYEFGKRGITVNIVSPGATDTQMLHDANPGDTFESTVAFTALRRLGQPADVADVVALLAGPDSHWITGQNITASGGLML